MRFEDKTKSKVVQQRLVDAVVAFFSLINVHISLNYTTKISSIFSPYFCKISLFSVVYRTIKLDDTLFSGLLMMFFMFS
jgi:hypothetical protein